ncbi:LLM class F420-dependent oxidoreductase [Streptomyces sp. NPDC091271]|uniref:LLM class F420-dependent oxidoreductase n=1 Tax=Streptomyces sp. NPDC091271 TaxID=3365980 RepID=UPI00380966AA
MKFTVEYPVSAAGYDRALVGRKGMEQVVRAAEDCGYDAIAFTEHPAPSKKWLDAGGHESLDLTSALSFCAALTGRIRLMTYLLVLPYRNPFVTAKALTTVDLLSDGRLTVVAGTGYLRSEFRSLGVEFAERNELFDEALEVMRGAWTTVPYAYEGRHFEAGGVASVPLPAQAGGPPVWIGGNSSRARARAARNQGWSPLMVSDEVARTTRSPGISTIEALASHITRVREAAAAEQGGDAPFDVQVQTPGSRHLLEGGSAEEHRDHLGRLAEAGVTSFVVQTPGDSAGRAADSLREYAETVGIR